MTQNADKGTYTVAYCSGEKMLVLDELSKTSDDIMLDLAGIPFWVPEDIFISRPTGPVRKKGKGKVKRSWEH